MSSSESNSRFSDSLRQYADLKVEELKLSGIESLSGILSKMLLFLLIFILCGLVIGLLAIAFALFIGYLTNNTIIGFLCSAALVLLLIIVLTLCRKRFMKNIFIRAFADQMLGEGVVTDARDLRMKKEIVKIAIDSQENKIQYTIIENILTLLKKIFN